MPLKVYVIIELFLTVIGAIVCPWWFLSVLTIIPFIVFTLRMIGIVKPFSTIFKIEVTILVLTFIAGLLMERLTFVAYILFLGIRAIFELVARHEDKTYVYYEEESL